MNFANPKMLWLMLVSMPVLLFFLGWGWRRKQFLIRQFVQSRLLSQLTVGVSARRQQVRLALVAAAVGLVFLALARPQWGVEFEEARHFGLDIIVALDTSKSMLAEDTSPNRLERAKLAVHDLVRVARQDRLGLVPFAGTAFLQCPLTTDAEAFRQSLELTEVGIIPRGGTSLAEAIRTATDAFEGEDDNFKVLVLFTDGEDHEGGALPAAQRAARAGVRIFTVGVGTASGELIREATRSGGRDFLRDPDGHVVKSRLNEELLGQIAEVTGGFYLHLSGVSPMKRLYDQGLASLPRGEQSSQMVAKRKERYQWPLALALLCLLLEMFIPERRAAPAQSGRPVASSLLWTGAARVGLAGFLGLWSYGAHLPVHGSPKSAFQKFQAGEYLGALEEYRALAERDPDNPTHRYNAGVAAYKNGAYDEAARSFAQALTSPDLELQQRAFYNLGNAFYRLGETVSEPPVVRQAWEQSAQCFAGALKLDPEDEDSQHNLEFVRQRLAELEEPPPPPPQPEGEDEHPQEQPESEQDQNGEEQQQQQQQQSGESGQPEDSESSRSDEDSDENERPSPDDGEEESEFEPQEQPSPSPEAEGDPGQDSPREAPAAPPPGQMTPEQARQLLDTQKNEERGLLFIPPDDRARTETYKDW